MPSRTTPHPSPEAVSAGGEQDKTSNTSTTISRMHICLETSLFVVGFFLWCVCAVCAYCPS